MCDEQDTDQVDVQKAILEELQTLVIEVRGLKERIDILEERTEQVVTDLHTVHELQRTYTSRLAVMEQQYVNQPLATEKKPSRPPGGDGKVDP